MAKSQKERFPSPLCHHLFKGLTVKLRRWDTPREVRIVLVRVLLRYTYSAGWWQLKYFFHVHLYTWGNDPIWQAYVSKGLKPPTSPYSARSRNLRIPMYALPPWIIILFLGSFVPPPSTWYHSPLLTLTQWNSWKSHYTSLENVEILEPQKSHREVWLKHHFPFKKTGWLVRFLRHWFSTSFASFRLAKQLQRPSTNRELFPVKN